MNHQTQAAKVQYLVKQIRTCPVCKGQRVIQNPIWTEFWKANPPEKNLSQDETIKWFYDHGYSNSPFMRMDRLPDEEIVCGECDGEGEITSEVELLTAINELAGRYDHA